MNKKRESLSGLSVAIKGSYENNEKLDSIEKKKLPAEFYVKIANTLEERESVYQLAYEIYLEKGYIQENANQWYIQNYDFYQQTIILIVFDKNKKLAGALTLIFNEDGKLPVEKIYSEEIRPISMLGNRILESSRLVIHHDYRYEKEVLHLLLNYMLIYSYHVKKYHSMMIQVNPRHKLYYKALLHYDEIGGEKLCPTVQNAPAVLLHLPLNRYQEEIKHLIKTKEKTKKERSLYPYFLKPEQELLVSHYLEKQAKPMSLEEKIYFGFSESGITRNICV
jgi:hypothetical protein